MRFVRNLVVSALVLPAAAIGVFAQSFNLSQNGKTVGNATLTLTPSAAVRSAGQSAALAGAKPAAGKAVPGQTGAGQVSASRPATPLPGFNLSSELKISMQGLNYSFTETATLNSAYHLNHVALNGLVNGTSANVDVTRVGQRLTMKINANGSVTNTPQVYHPGSVFMPDFDPGALQVLLKLGASTNNSDLWALIPKQTGLVSALRIATMADEQGTLNGAPTVVHHLTVTTDLDKIEIFSGPDHELFQAEWTQQAFALVRQGFVLKHPAHAPGAPPARPATTPAAPVGQPQQN